MQIRTLGVIELFRSHTTKDLKHQILSVRRKCSISANQIHTATVDNASNMINSDFEAIAVRCAAHTVQPAVNDLLKDESISSILDRARKTVKKLRTITVINL